LEYVLRDAGCETVLCEPRFAEMMRPLCASLGLACVVLGEDVEFGEAKDAEIVAPPPFCGERAGLIVYTSGTTGPPKGSIAAFFSHTVAFCRVLLSHGNLQAQVQALLGAWAWSEEDVILHPLPLHHVHGVSSGPRAGHSRLLGCQRAAMRPGGWRARGVHAQVRR
jgi:malonyl-CoA/methylmalonyl-CoA synthetase